MTKTGSRRSFLLALATLVVLTFAASDAEAQGITDCKACGLTCSATYGCYQNCIRISYDDCHRYNMTCRGVCYTYYDYTYGERQCSVSDWYPCYA